MVLSGPEARRSVDSIVTQRHPLPTAHSCAHSMHLMHPCGVISWTNAGTLSVWHRFRWVQGGLPDPAGHSRSLNASEQQWQNSVVVVVVVTVTDVVVTVVVATTFEVEVAEADVDMVALRLLLVAAASSEVVEVDPDLTAAGRRKAQIWPNAAAIVQADRSLTIYPR